MNHQFQLDGKRCLVTGGATGIGRAIAIGMAKAGAQVAITTNRQAARETVEAFASFGAGCHCVAVDLAAPDAAAAVEASLAEAFGPLDILVNNAGIIRRDDAVAYSEANWQDVMAVNLDAVWRLSQQLGRGMVERGAGRIINVASLLSMQGGVRVPAYAASKHAVLGLTRALCNEWASRGVTVNAIAPGYIETDNTQPLREDPQRSRQILERIPAGRWGRPEDIAGAAVFLASDAAAYVNGQVLAVDGGWMAR